MLPTIRNLKREIFETWETVNNSPFLDIEMPMKRPRHSPRSLYRPQGTGSIRSWSGVLAYLTHAGKVRSKESNWRYIVRFLPHSIRMTSVILSRSRQVTLQINLFVCELENCNVVHVHSVMEAWTTPPLLP